jgi:spore coat polysaccharide biosynthesis protein SpsF
MPKPTVAAIIQARMGSSRLPGKVLQPLSGKPVLWHIIHRLRKCRTVDVIAIATSDQPCDDVLVEFSAREGVSITRGPEDNVLLRYAKAAEDLNPDIIVRVTGDAPIVDPNILDQLVDTLIKENADYCLGEPGVPTIHEGFAPFTRNALNRLLSEAAEDPVAVEHVTSYFSEHPEKFDIAYISVPTDHHFQGARLSVDTPADLRFLEELYRHLGVPAGEADMAHIVRTLKAHPELLEINSHIYQKKVTDRSLKVLIRCDSDGGIGFGHVVRCLAMADELRELHGCGITFALFSGENGRSMIENAGFPLLEPPAGQDEASWLDSYIAANRPDILILDIRSDLPPATVGAWRRSGILVATLDDPSDRRLETDLAFYPPVPQVQELGWNGYSGEVHTGWDWVVLRQQFADKKPTGGRRSAPHILVSMGGSDPAGLTLTALRDLDGMEGDFDTTVVVGPGFSHGPELDNFISDAHRSYRLAHNVQEMWDLMSKTDLAVVSFGVTAYELAALGVPAIYYCLSDDHARSAGIFNEAGIGVNLGLYSSIDNGKLAAAVSDLLKDRDLMSGMSRSALKLVDGLGTRRIAKVLVDRALEAQS